MSQLIPVLGAFVIREGMSKEHIGVLVERSKTEPDRVKVQWFKEENQLRWESVACLKNGFQVGMQVLHIPENAFSVSLGQGTIQRTQEVAGSEQLLVDFPEENKRLWLPWQNMRMLRSVEHRFCLGDYDKGEGAERLRLRILAWALILWNENTGALAEFDIDPLPHQIHLVHHILTSDNHNWLIADDVGLGKTIETGLLLSALRQRKQARRVLLITPSGLTRQWREEMYAKFNIDDFVIYGDNFFVHEARDWKRENYVIASMDRIKNDNHLDSLMQAEPWDLVIVDEAHRFSRRQYGNKYDSSQRYSMLSQLRNRTETIILLTATPHQGKEDSFVGLLELLRPERRKELLSLAQNPEIISDMVYRNYKADVTDIAGNFIFQGKTVRQISVPSTEEVQAFDESLQQYLRLGYAAGAVNSNKAKAIGFVMTIYRKLASSSVAAIHLALERRLSRLLGEFESLQNEYNDERYQGEQEEISITKEISPFFEGEIDLLKLLIGKAARLKQNDHKIKLFMQEIVHNILQQNSQEKLLIFSEYRGTQGWIESALVKQFGRESTVLIHGSMSLDERLDAIERFEREEDSAQFLISTEAGGEGINLQQRCNIMVNYDLPWNPMRLVQRIGRLYRYGQQKRVVVFNIHQNDSADDQIMNILYRRIDQVVRDMTVVDADEFNEALSDDILGQVADLLDVEAILQQAANETIDRTRSRIDEALQRARDAAGKQHDLFQYASSFSDHELQSELTIDLRHLQAFVAGMCVITSVEVVERKYQGLVWSLRLPEAMTDELGINRTRWDITFDRGLAAKRKELLHMNPDNWLLAYWLKKATHYDFKGTCSLATDLSGQAVVATITRWQNKRGSRMKQELALLSATTNQVDVNPEWLSQWLLQPQGEVIGQFINRNQASKIFKQAQSAITELIKNKTGGNLMPEFPQYVAACGNSGADSKG